MISHTWTTRVQVCATLNLQTFGLYKKSGFIIDFFRLEQNRKNNHHKKGKAGRI